MPDDFLPLFSSRDPESATMDPKPKAKSSPKSAPSHGVKPIEGNQTPSGPSEMGGEGGYWRQDPDGGWHWFQEDAPAHLREGQRRSPSETPVHNDRFPAELTPAPAPAPENPAFDERVAPGSLLPDPERPARVQEMGVEDARQYAIQQALAMSESSTSPRERAFVEELASLARINPYLAGDILRKFKMGKGSPRAGAILGNPSHEYTDKVNWGDSEVYKHLIDDMANRYPEQWMSVDIGDTPSPPEEDSQGPVTDMANKVIAYLTGR